MSELVCMSDFVSQYVSVNAKLSKCVKVSENACMCVCVCV